MPWDKPLKSVSFAIREDFKDESKRLAAYAQRQMQLRTPVGDPSRWKSKPPKNYVGGDLRRSWELERRGDSWVIFSSKAYAERIWVDGWSSLLAEGAVDVLLNDLRYYDGKS